MGRENWYWKDVLKNYSMYTFVFCLSIFLDFITKQNKTKNG